MIILRKVDKLAACQRNGGRQSRALSTDRILGHLYQQTLTFADQLFDRAVLAVFLPGSFDVKHMQKSRAFQPDIHKGRLHTREHPQHLADIDVADKARLAARSMWRSSKMPSTRIATRVSRGEQLIKIS